MKKSEKKNRTIQVLVLCRNKELRRKRSSDSHRRAMLADFKHLKYTLLKISLSVQNQKYTITATIKMYAEGGGKYGN